ncbi:MULTISPECIES: PAS domain-containing protein [unclassified Polaribacter]|uniref:PAS domain-containing protein n=2 Tax=Polaribacter TaxID=52959 RepID=UPI001C4E6F56|nr:MULTISPECIES: PAS domain-containing protein [unclassified Polaribacter]QXP64577.1 PAS domain-containing protein [Polaribacter sp. HaHaR_3_91]QXP67072.1 PAS domain-containing protein [Polaribacter sp. AHE13PA]QXP69177.1 PAS domain-containing protein [Polaribacter sp. R2A056_3_33]
MKNNLTEMKCLDIYLSGLNKEEYNEIKPKVEISKVKTTPLVSWDIFMDDYYIRLIEAKKRMEIEQVLSFAKKFNWKNDLNLAFSENDYEALIVTDKNQNIIWVNEGFTSMTGYSKKFAINKTPKFLQGEETSVKTKNRIQEKIEQVNPFKEIIVNYKKDGTAYNCEVKIIPLFNENTTHYLAFEKKIG